jgi:glycosyltransferase involved in cell wall biosynthesis
MKVALLVPGGVDASGEDRVIHSRLWLIERLGRRHEVHVFALGQNAEPGQWDLLGARVHDVGQSRGRARRLWKSFAAEHRASRFAVIHAFFGWCGTHAALLGQRHDVPVVFHPSGGELVAMRDIEYGMGCSLVGRVALRTAIAGATKITVATPFMRRLAAERGIDAECVPIGVALDRWPASAVRARKANGPARLLHIGDIRPVKDQETLVAAAGTLQHRGVDFVLDVAGHDTTNGQFRSSTAVQTLGARLRWHGVLRRPELRRLVDQADLLLVSSRHEAGPLAVLEAAVAGVPTVGTAVGHVHDWAPHAAVAVPIGDASALARETESLLGDDTRRRALATTAQLQALAIDADYTARTFERIYGEVTST